MDRTKYLEPKFGEHLEPLAKHIKDNCDSDAHSTITSNISVFKNNAGVKGDSASLLAITGQQSSVATRPSATGANVDL